MRLVRLDEMKNGWFIGDFEPSLYKTRYFEVAVKRYRAGEYERPHYHKIATEMTVIVSGEAEMNGIKCGPGDIIMMEPGEAADFRAKTDVVIVPVKIPCVINDKYKKYD